MPTPVFREYTPAGDCPCPGCVAQRTARRAAARTAAPTARQALVLVTAAGVVLGGAGTAAAGAPHTPGPDPVRPAPAPAPAGTAEDTPQGTPGSLHGPRPAPGSGPAAPDVGPATAPGVRRTDRATIINRARRWLDAKVPYSMSTYWTDGYRQDCSGFVSMAWDLGTNEWTGSLDRYAVRITKEQLQPGDILLFHNPADPSAGSHVTIFGGWTDHTRTYYTAYEQTRPHTRKQATPYGYWNNAAKYLPYRYTGLSGVVAEPVPETPAPSPVVPAPTPAPKPPAAPAPAPGPGPGTAYPGRGAFGPGASNPYVKRLGTMLVARGAARFYPDGPGTRWTEADRRATRAFQQAQGWTGADADGLPGPATWRLLVTKQGRGIPAAPTGSGTPTVKAPAYPGAAVFRPGSSHPAVEALGRQLVRKGFGKHYTKGPGKTWGEADRRNTEAFQRALGWRGAAADGYPGPETWRRLFA
ncbi:peptidoglycan-binding protein [Streptomyces sp. NPDC097619]|uniref:peptidoglycan-binding protein n=1 Tax=Streptomyces sp. NPDC097619 TaxID=3157228 RepID=UPI00331B3D0D